MGKKEIGQNHLIAICYRWCDWLSLFSPVIREQKMRGIFPQLQMTHFAAVCACKSISILTLTIQK